MIDEWYDRTYLECRVELNATLIRLLTKAARAIPKSQTSPAGDMSCSPDPSAPSSQRSR